MKTLLGALVFAIVLIVIPIALVTVPAAANRDTEASERSADTEPGWAACGIRLECLQ